MNVTEKFSAALESFSLDGGVLIALSGGADSSCLIHLFISARKRGLFHSEIAAAHLNHSLRGKEADRDEEFCRCLCEENGIPFFSRTLDIGAMAKASGLSTEEEARNARYAFFSDILEGNPSLSYVATAHNKNDLVETMLLNAIRGSGIDGLRSIPRMRDNIIRPLIDVSREEILGYMEENGLSYVTDSSNLETEYTRNKIRHNVLPRLSEISDGFLDCLYRTSCLLSTDASFLNDSAASLYPLVVEDGVLYTKKAQNLHRSMLSRIIKALYNNSGFSGLTEAHIDAICTKVLLGNENFSLSLHGCRAVCERSKLYFTCESPMTDFDVKFGIGESVMLQSGISVSLSEKKSDGAIPLKKEALCGILRLRSRRDGDTIRQKGKTHKIKRMISDKKLSACEKEKLFFLTSDGAIVFTNIPAISDTAFTKGGENCVYLTIKESL